jgi:hypothetical protein
LILFVFQKTFMFLSFFVKKRLRVLGNNLRTPFTGGAEAHNGAADGATEAHSRGFGSEENEGIEAGGARKI